MLRLSRTRALASRGDRSKLKRCEALRAQKPLRSRQGEGAPAQLAQKVGVCIAGALASLSVLVAPGSAEAAELTLQFKASPVPEVRDAQARLVQSYAYVKYYYVDDSFNGVDWDAAYKAALDQTYEAQSGGEVDAITTKLLKRLDDPFTRLLSPQASKNYKAEKQGTFRSFGIGADCSSAAQAGACVLDYVQSGSAAAEAGLRTGTQVVAFQQQPINEATARDLKKALQQRDRDDIQLSVRRDVPSSSVSSADDAEFAFADEAPSDPPATTVTLQQRAVDVDPVQFATVSTPAGKDVAYLRLANFADNAVKSVEGALQKLDSASGLVLDLRDNPGGTVGPGLDIAGNLLPNGSSFVSIAGREMGSERIAINKPGARPAVAKRPMVVLVNNNTASTSEMLASALRAKGATLVGDTTLGKGRTQQMFELPRGELLFVSVLKYKGAAGESIDKTGLKPDRVCAPQATGQQRYTSGSLHSSADLRSDPCISLAVDLLANKALSPKAPGSKAAERPREVLVAAEQPALQRSGAADKERREKEFAEQARQAAEKKESERAEAAKGEAEPKGREQQQQARAATGKEAQERTPRGTNDSERTQQEQAQPAETQGAGRNERKELKAGPPEKQDAKGRERERTEQDRAAAEKQDADRKERERTEQARAAAEKQDADRKERERTEQERVAAEKQNAERQERERTEQARAAAEKQDAERKGRERTEQATATADKNAARKDAERREQEREAVAKREAQERQAAEVREQERSEAANKEVDERKEAKRREERVVAAERDVAERKEADRRPQERAAAAKQGAEERQKAEGREQERTATKSEADRKDSALQDQTQAFAVKDSGERSEQASRVTMQAAAGARDEQGQRSERGNGAQLAGAEGGPPSSRTAEANSERDSYEDTESLIAP